MGTEWFFAKSIYFFSCRENESKLTDSSRLGKIISKFYLFLFAFKSGGSQQRLGGSLQRLEDPYRDLFIWAVLNNMGEMAVRLWAHGKDALVKALIGKMLFEAMAKLADGEHMPHDIINEIQHNSK